MLNILPADCIGIIEDYCDFLTLVRLNSPKAHTAYDSTIHTWKWASENGHLEVVQWLHEHRTEGCTTWAMDVASKNGYLDVVNWLRENNKN